MQTKEIKDFTLPTCFKNGKITGREITDGVLRGFVICIYQEQDETMCHIFNPKLPENESFGFTAKYNENISESAIVNTFVDLIAQDIARYCLDTTSRIYFQQSKPRIFTKEDLPKKLLNFPNTFHMFEAQKVINKTVEYIDRFRDEKYGSDHNMIIETILKGTKNNVLGAYKNSISDITINEITIPNLKIETSNPQINNNDRGGLGDK